MYLRQVRVCACVVVCSCVYLTQPHGPKLVIFGFCFQNLYSAPARISSLIFDIKNLIEYQKTKIKIAFRDSKLVIFGFYFQNLMFGACSNVKLDF